MKNLLTTCVLCILFSSLGSGQTLVDKSVKLFNEGNYREATGLLQEALRQNPKNDSAYYYLGMINMNDSYDKAIEYLKKAVELQYGNAKYHLMLGNAYGVKAQKAGIFSKFGAAKDCLSEFETAARVDPKYIDARRSLVEYYLQAPGIMGGSVDKAVTQSDTILMLDRYAGYLTKARISEYQKRQKDTEGDYLQAIAVDPRKTPAYRGLWWFYVSNKDEVKADAVLARAVKAVDDKSEIYYWAGLYYVQVNNLEKAKDMFHHALKEDSTDAPVYYQLGKVACLSGTDLQGGLASLRKYISMPLAKNSPTYDYAHWRMGMIYEKLGNKEAAKSEYRKSLQINPDLDIAKKSLANMK
ncbi:MAG: tetratricopeptide repeat protein [Bacteroidetes bacterium]|nr:tetratricopeptide repeat protein [Bacteroidota bacterium]MCL5267995.1 tetratricopeptide repeat protein [Bacteroidota bacterium]